MREIDASQGRLGGREQANAGRIMGIIGTVLLALGILLVLGLFALLAAGSTGEYSLGTAPAEPPQRGGSGERLPHVATARSRPAPAR